MTKEKVARTAAQTAVLMAILTLGSKILGFIREMVMAGFFGTSYITDAYVMATAIPSMIFGGVFGAVSTAFMPLYSKTTETEGIEQGKKFINETFNLLLFVSLLSAVIGLMLSDQIVMVFASGFTGEAAKLTSFYVKVTFAYVIFTSTTGLLEAFLRYRGIFLAPFIANYLQNGAVIMVIVLSAYYSYYYLAFGWLIANIIRFIIVGYLATKKDYHYKYTVHFGNTAKKIIILSLPVFIGSHINQINAFVDKTLASGLSVGSVSALNYGNLLVNLVVGMTISIIMTIIYPKMTQAHSLKNNQHFNDMISTGFNLICIITIPCMLGAMAYSDQIVQIVYERGVFDPTATALTSTAFFFYSIGLVFRALNSLLIQTYYSMHDMKTPVIYAAVGVVINIILNLILVEFLSHGGLALATSISAVCNSLLLYYGLRKKYSNLIIIKEKKNIFKIVIIAVISVGISKLCYLILNYLINLPNIILLGTVIIIAVLIYIILSSLIKIEELKLLKQLIKK